MSRHALVKLIGCIVSALAIGGIMYLLDAAWGYGSKELPAPQATLMKLVVEGVMGGSLPWTLVLAGAGIAIAIEIIGIPVLPVAIGLYLPIHLSAPIYAGGLLRAFFDRKGEEGNKITEKGILYGSGMIAGEGLAEYILYATTNEGVTYRYLTGERCKFGRIPCGRNEYYQRRRLFYYLLSKRMEERNVTS